MNLNLLLVSVSILFYGAAFGGYFFKFKLEKERLRWPGHLLESGFLVHTLLIFSEIFTGFDYSGFHFPVATLGEASGFFAWSLAFVFLILIRRFKTESFALILAPVLVLFLIPSLFPSEPNPSSLKYFNNPYFLIHILSAFFGYASFALSFIAAVFYLVLDFSLKQKKSGNFYKQLPALEDLEHFIFTAIFWGVILLAAGILSGSFWAKSAFSSYFVKEPKSFASLLTWTVYLVIIYLHGFLKIKGRRIVRMSLLAFVLVLFTFLGTSLFKTGFHVGIW